MFELGAFEPASARLGARAEECPFSKTASSSAPASEDMPPEAVGTEGTFPGAVSELAASFAAGLASDLIPGFEVRLDKLGFTPELTLLFEEAQEPDLELVFVANSTSVTRLASTFASSFVAD